MQFAGAQLLTPVQPRPSTVQSGISPNFNRSRININAVDINAYSFTIKPAAEPIKVDGILDEAAWADADSVYNFYQNFPYDTGYSFTRSTVRICYDSKFLYVSAILYDELPGNYVVQNLNRDWNHGNSDGFQFVIDPMCDRTNGFAFAISPYGSQREGIITNGGNDGISLAWDNKWYSGVTRYPDKWVAEMAVPFSTIRYKAGLKEWRINFARFDYKRNEMSTWVPLYRNFSVGGLVNTGRMIWEKPLEKPGRNVSVIPYIGGVATQLPPPPLGPGNPPPGPGKPPPPPPPGPEKRPLINTLKLSAGLDAKVAVTPSMNLDLTINPDFSQVEVDQQVINLSRFEPFFPERRTFFLENADLFGNFGSGRERPFFSRRIGISRNPSTGLYTQNPILFGARLSGKINRDWRLGVMNVMTPNKPSDKLPAQNFSMLALQRQVFSRSTVSFYYTGRQALGSDSVFGLSPDAGNANHSTGLEYNMATGDNRWRSKLFVHKTFGPDGAENRFFTEKNTAYSLTASYTDRHKYFYAGQEYIGTGYRAEVGYVPRTGYIRYEGGTSYSFLPKNSIISQHGPSLNWYSLSNLGRGLGDMETNPTWYVGFNNSASLQAGYTEYYSHLNGDFSVKNNVLPAGGVYHYRTIGLNFVSNLRRSFAYDAALAGGSYYNMGITSLSGSVNYRWVPYVLLSCAYSYSHLQMPDDMPASELLLIRPSVNLSLRNNVFFRCTVQFNTQAQNLGSNLRFQWRFAPASDFFLVYSDNYQSSDLRFKDRGLTAKLTYWINM
ncbi:MAG: DUF5916 domain-containing protein [Bacteroidota bacterium]